MAGSAHTVDKGDVVTGLDIQAPRSRGRAVSRPPASKRGNRVALAAVTFATGLAFAGWTLLGPLGPGLQQDLNLNDTSLGLLMATPVLVGSLLRLPVGALADRFGGRRVLAALLAVTPLPLVLMGAFHHSFTVLIASAMLLGVAGSSFAAGVRFVETRFPAHEHGFALGIYGIAVGGTVATALVAPRLAHSYGLTVPFYVLAGSAVVACVVFLAFTREDPEESHATSEGANAASLSSFARSSGLMPATLFYAVAFGGFIACFAYLPKLLVSDAGVTPTIAASWAASFAAISVGARVAGGKASDRHDPRAILRWSFVAVIAASVGLAAGYGNPLVLMIAFAALGLAFGMAAGATMKLISQYFDAELGRAAGVVGAAGGLGGFIPPLLLATMAGSETGYTLPFLGLSVTAGICLVIAVRLEPRPVTTARRRPEMESEQCR